MCKPIDPAIAALEAKQEALAKVFADKIAQTHTSEACEQIVRRNRNEEDAGICHSHDFCDANELMMRAYCEVFAITEEEFDMTEEIASNINEAWAIARINEFWF